MKKDSKQRLFEVTQKLDKTFKPKLNEENNGEGEYDIEGNKISDGESGRDNYHDKIEAEKYFNRIYDTYSGDEKQIFKFFLNAVYSPSPLWAYYISREFQHQINSLYANKFGRKPFLVQ